VTEPVRLSPDPAVAVAAYRFPSRSAPGRTYDVAFAQDGTVSCECWPFLKVDKCAHVAEAERLMRREAAREERQAKLDARLGCLHPLTVDDEEWNESAVWRRCLGCGHVYDRLPHIVALHEAIRARHRLPSSPWTGAERAGDTE
jgi:hypothetical protein